MYTINMLAVICLIAITFISAFLSTLNLLAISSSRLFVLFLAIITIAVGASLNFKKKGKFTLIALVIVTCIYFISVMVDPRERRVEYQSPMGTNTIIIEYDHASRPSIYRKENFLFMTPIGFDLGPGYNETVSHEVIWLSENKVKLTDYYGDEWIVDWK